MTTFTALGDSITLGVGDPVRPAGQERRAWRGWAAWMRGRTPLARASDERSKRLHTPAL